MKLDTMNIMINNRNTDNSLKNENTRLSNDFINIFNKSSNEGLFNKKLTDDNELEDSEKLLMQLIEMMIKNINEIDNLDDFIDKLNNDKDLLSKTLEKCSKEIISTLSIDEYFLGNDMKMQEIINNLESLKKENGIDEVTTLLDKLKDRLSFEDSNGKSKNDFTINEYSKNISIQNSIEKNFGEDLLKIDSKISKELNDYGKEIKSLKGEDKINSLNDKELNILQDIAKDDSNKFILSDNKYRTVRELDISSSKTNVATEIRSSNFNQDMIESIDYLKNNNLQELKVSLNPKELGEISIKLTKNDKDTKLTIVVAKDEVYSLVNKNLKEITKHLENLDIKVNEISVDIKSDNQNSFSDNLNKRFKEQKEKRKNNSKENIEKIEIENIRVVNEDNINLLA